MIYFKIWVLCITVCSCKKELTVMSALRDTIELSNAENPGSVTGATLSQSQKDALLQLHNGFRSMVKPTASNMLRMTWDDDLEKISSDFANKCIVAHNPDRHKLAKNYDWVGENIAWGTGTCGEKECGDVYEGVKRWFSESKSYNFLTGQCSGKCTLYTQMVWWESNKLGCGAKRCGDRTILVCNYAPGGNYVGQRPYKSAKVCSECPSGLTCEDNLCTEAKKNDVPTETDLPKKVTSPTAQVSCPAGATKKEDAVTGVMLCPTNEVPAASSHSLPAGWIELPTRLTQIDSGITPMVWGMNGRHEIFYLNTNNELVPLIYPRPMHHISAGQSGVWAVGQLGNVFLRKGVDIQDGGLSWERVPGNLKQIDSGPSGLVWGVNRYNRVFCRIGIDKKVRPVGTGWMRIEGNMKYVSCGELGCWAVNCRDNIYFREGVTEELPQGVRWKVIVGKLRMVESGPAGLTVGLSDANELFLRQGVSTNKPEGVKWLKLDLKLAHVTVGDRGIIGILPDGTVAIFKDTNSFVYQTPTIAPTDSGVAVSQALPLDAITSPTVAPINENPVTSQTLESSLEALQQLNPNSATTTSANEREQLHISPDMAAKILKLIEQKGNQFEDSHKAAAAAAVISRNATLNALSMLSQKSEDALTPPDAALKNATVDATPKPFSPALPALTPAEEPTEAVAAQPEASETKATSQESAASPEHPAEERPAETPAPESPAPSEHAVTTTALPQTTTMAQSKVQKVTSTISVTHQKQVVGKTTPSPTTVRAHTHGKTSSSFKQMYPQPRLPTKAPVVTHRSTPHPKPRTTSETLSLHTKTHANWVHSVAPALPPTQTLRTAVQQQQHIPTATAPTSDASQLRPTYAAPHALSAGGTMKPMFKKPPVSKMKTLGVHKLVLFAGGVQPTKFMGQIQTPPQIVVRPATVSLQMTRSCCAIPDSVCPIPKDCVGYIECHGYHGNYKNCDRGKMFNPITNICDYPRNVDCESVKASAVASTQSTTSTSTFVTTTSTTQTADTVPSTTPASPPPPPPPPASSGSTISNAVPQYAPPEHVVPAVRDEPLKAQEPIQPRVNRPHTDDDGVLREVWFGLGLSPLLTLLTNNPRFPTNPDEYIVLDKFEAPPNAGDGYGQRLSTYYKAPLTGEFVFYISCDNECELWISPDTEEIHSNLILELKHGHFTSFRQWHKYPQEQTSRPIFLQQNEYYFIESFMKEGAGGDDLSVGVKHPNGEFDLPISKNLYLVPGETSTGSLTRKVGQSLLLQQPEQTVQKTAQQYIAPPAPPVASPPSTSFQQTPASTGVLNPINPSLLGPQPGQTAQQWVEANNKPNSGSTGYQSQEQLASVANNAGNIPGAEMYSHHDDDLEAFEQNDLQLRTSVKRNSISNHSAIR